MTINISDEAHAKLLQLQLEGLIKNGKKIPLAQLTAEYLHAQLVEAKKPD
ncbi:MAG: hypothetical protein RIC03_12565 [Cyclobacteriaceae bacterium]